MPSRKNSGAIAALINFKPAPDARNCNRDETGRILAGLHRRAVHLKLASGNMPPFDMPLLRSGAELHRRIAIWIIPEPWRNTGQQARARAAHIESQGRFKPDFRPPVFSSASFWR